MAISFVGSAVNSANNPTSGDWTLHADWQPGDVAIFWWYTFTAGKTVTEPAGVTQKHDVATTNHGRLFIGYRTLQTGDSTFGFTSSNVSASTTIWGTSIFRGVVSTGDPFEVESGAPAIFLNVNDPDPPAVTPATTGAAVFTIFGKANDYTSITPPINYTSAGEGFSIDGSDASAGTAYRLDRTGGISEDPGIFTLGGGLSTDDGYVWSGALEPAATGVIADLSVTLGAVTLSSAVIVDVAGSLDQTLAPLTLSSAGTIDVAASLISTLGAATLSSTATGDVVAVLSQSLSALTLSSAGVVDVSATLSQTLGPLTLSATGSVDGEPPEPPATEGPYRLSRGPIHVPLRRPPRIVQPRARVANRYGRHRG